MANKQKLYKLADDLSNELGLKRVGKWTGTTSDYWGRQVTKLQRNIKNRKNNFERAVRLSDESRVPLKIPKVIHGTSNENWKKEVRRIQMRVRRAENKVTVVRIAAIRANRQRIVDESKRPKTQKNVDLIKEMENEILDKEIDIAERLEDD